VARGLAKLACCAIAGALTAPALAAEPPKDLTSLSLEQLLDVEVSIVSKTDEPLTRAAAAVTVVTGEEIRRSGATSLPEALRLVPGLHVSRVTSSIWEVSSRGFSNVSSAKLLVLMDGRSVYTPLFSGVLWDSQDTLLEDIDRIEVIRGPGASIWGANAMNGVINILTKSAKDTQGTYMEAGGGNDERGFAGIRYGDRIGDSIFYRVYGKFFNRLGGDGSDGVSDDGWHAGRIGFRADAAPTERDRLTFQGDGYLGEIGQIAPALAVTGRPSPAPPLSVDIAGANVMGSWTRQLGEGADFTIRAYYDRTHRDDPTFGDDLDTVDVEGQTGVALPGSQELLIGANYRLMHDQFVGKGIAEVRPGTSSDQLVSAFVEDHLSLLGDSLRFAVGTKLEHNDFSGFEVQPNLRIAWDPAAGQTVWTALSRAVRVPTRIERDISAISGDPNANPTIHVVGNPNAAAETLIAAELGYRVRAGGGAYVDLAAFYFNYDDLLSLDLGTPFVQNGQTVVPVLFQNEVHGHALGGEAAVTVTALPGWQLGARYSFVDAELETGGMDLSHVVQSEHASPRHQIGFQSLVNLPASVQLDTFVRWVDEIEAVPGGAATPSYLEADARAAWRPTKSLELSVIGKSLLHAQHTEFPGGTDVQRSVYGKLAARF
jgi:iron complex outermembrane recepter protein